MTEGRTLKRREWVVVAAVSTLLVVGGIHILLRVASLVVALEEAFPVVDLEGAFPAVAVAVDLSSIFDWESRMHSPFFKKNFLKGPQQLYLTNHLLTVVEINT